MKIVQNFTNFILFTASIIGLVSTWTCRPGSNGTFQDGGLCPKTADCRYDQLGTCEHVTIDPCTCCPTCPVPTGNSCSSARSGFGGICQNNHFCVLDAAKNRHSPTHKTGICLNSDMLVDLRCDNGTNFSGCAIYTEQCFCQNVKLCPNLSAIFPFPDKKSCQEKLNSILRYELDSNPPSDTHLRCPSDSVEVPGSGAQNSIGFSKEHSFLENSSQFHCRCDMSKCHMTCNGKNGGSHFDLKLLSPGNDKIPGKCCPTYECLPTPLNKSHVNCRDAICPHDEAEFACSSDSIILPSLFTHDHCCPVPQGCQCLKDLCQPPPICKDGQWPALTFRGNGIPGSCCDVFTCQDIESKGDLKEDSSSCKSGDYLHENGASWDKDACVTCYCRAGLTFCQAKNCSSEYCHHHSNDTCCPECQLKKVMCVSESGIKYQSNDTWTEGDCVHCVCNVNGKVECISQMCALPRDCAPDDMVKIGGVCCPICQTNVSNEITDANSNGTLSNMSTPVAPNLHCHSKRLGLYFAPEQTWTEDCRRCYCMDGITLCTLLTCPIPKCEKPFYSPGDCCPSCPGQIKASPYSNYTECKVLRSPYANVISDLPSLANEISDVKTLDSSYFYSPKLSNGVYDSWWIDNCINCICREGVVYCSVSECKPTPCHFPQSLNGPNSCCQGCLNEVERRNSHNHDRALATNPKSFCKLADGQLYDNGAQWYQDPCNSCKCHLGKVKCYSTTCPKQYCDKPLLQKGKCCPLCLGNVGNMPTEFDEINTLTTTPLDSIPGQDESKDKWRINLPGIVFFKRRAYFSYESLPFLLLLVLCVLLLVVVVYLLIYIYVKRDKFNINHKKPHSPRVKKFRFFKLSPHNLLKKSLLLHSPNLKESSTYRQTNEVQGDNYTALASNTALASMPDLEDQKLELEEKSGIYELKPMEHNKIDAIDYDTDYYLRGFEFFTADNTKDAKAKGCDKTMLSEDSGLTPSRNSSHSGSCKSSISSFNKSYYCLAPQKEPHENDLLVEKMV